MAIKKEDDMPDNCPHCGVSLLGEPIPQESRDKGYYAPESSHFRREYGIEIQGYDGVLFWRCGDCGGAWQRFDPTSPLGQLAEKYMTGVEHDE
jgi:hypothetical protein